MNTNNVIIRPLITERSMAMAGNGKYTFAIQRLANKTEIKKAVEEKFGVDVTGIGTRVVKGKTKRVGIRRMEIASHVYKKAIVTVKEGQKIGIFELGGGK